MPCEKISVHFKPVNFFESNPAGDVPPSVQVVNKSSSAVEAVQHQQGGNAELVVGRNGNGNGSATCCDANGSATNGHANGH